MKLLPHAAAAQQPAPCGKVVILSEHDYRTARRANIHAIADALARLGHEVTFISIRFSLLSLLKGDSRRFLLGRANRPETRDGIQSYLWFTPLHPFQPGPRWLQGAAAPLYRLYARLPNRFIDGAFRSAAFIVVESGLGVMLLRRARRASPSARLVYRASDNLDTIGAHPVLQREAEQAGPLVDQLCLVTRKMAPHHAWGCGRLFCVPHGIHPADFADPGPSPYGAGVNAVAVGSMLFDPGFFQLAAVLFPEVEFHVIGCGTDFAAPANVHIHPEMPFRRTIPYLAHASLGIAAYRPAAGAAYLSESSLKLLQYEHLGLPAVCPDFAAGGNPNRFAYRPGDASSIRAAIEGALARGRGPRRALLTWDEVAQRLLEPRRFPDTRIEPA